MVHSFPTRTKVFFLFYFFIRYFDQQNVVYVKQFIRVCKNCFPVFCFMYIFCIYLQMSFDRYSCKSCYLLLCKTNFRQVGGFSSVKCLQSNLMLFQELERAGMASIDSNVWTLLFGQVALTGSAKRQMSQTESMQLQLFAL